MRDNINLKELFQRTDKCVNVELISKIEEITSKGEFFFISIIDNNYYYEGLTILKSEIFPKPSINNVISIKKIYYKFDETFIPRIFIDAKICTSAEGKTENVHFNGLLGKCSRI